MGSGDAVGSGAEVASGTVELSCVDSSVEEASEEDVSLTSAFLPQAVMLNSRAAVRVNDKSFFIVSTNPFYVFRRQA